MKSRRNKRKIKKNRKSRRGGMMAAEPTKPVYTIEFSVNTSRMVNKRTPVYKAEATVINKTREALEEDAENPDEDGYFKISKSGGDLSTYALNIHIKERYRGLGMARQLVHAVCEGASKFIPRDEKIYVGGDSSQGFWRSIGMRPNPLELSSAEVPGAGFELVITFGQLTDWGNGIPVSRDEDGLSIARPFAPESMGPDEFF